MSDGLTVITPQVIYEEGAGKAYQSVAQSTALAIQDATDALRNINTISVTAIGVAIAQMLESPATAVQYQAVITQIFTVNAKAAENYTAIGKDAITILKDYPHGQ